MPTQTSAERETTQSTITREQAFRLSEASVALEGIDVTTDPDYLALKTRILANEITSQEAITLYLQRYKTSQTTTA